MSKSKNPFGLKIDPEPDLSSAGDLPHAATVTLLPGDFFPGHYHIPGPLGIYDREHIEIYHWLEGGGLTLFIRQSDTEPWRDVVLTESNPTFAVLAGWHHAGKVLDNRHVKFMALSRIDHFRPVNQGGNVHRLPFDKQPPSIRLLMRH